MSTSMTEQRPQTYAKMLWGGKWWIVLILLMCAGFIIGLAALLQLQPKRQTFSCSKSCSVIRLAVLR
jgi:hypothetical protein